MINYSILNTLKEKEIHKTSEVAYTQCYIKSRIKIEYQQEYHQLLPEAFEHLLHTEIEKMPREEDDLIATWIIHNKHEVEYLITMPVEIFPYYMDVLGRLYSGRYYDSLKVIDADVVYQFWWDNFIDKEE